MNDRAGHQTSSSSLANLHAAADRAEAEAAITDLQVVLARARALAEKLPRSREASLVITKIDEAEMRRLRAEVSNG